MTRKFFKLPIIAVTAVLALSACGSDNAGSGAATGSDANAPAGPTTLELWLPPTMTAGKHSDEEEWTRMLKPFEEQNNVDVKLTIVPWDNFEAKWLTGVSSGSGPDVGYMYAEMMGDYIQQQQLEPLGNYIEDAQLADLQYLNTGEFNGELYSLPFNTGGARVFFYNKAMLEKAGVTDPPVTWDDFLAAGEQVKASGGTAFTQSWGDPHFGSMNSAFYPWLWQAGGELFTADGTKTAFNSPEGLRAAEFLYSLKADGLMPDAVTGTDNAGAIAQFESGKSAFLIESDSYWQTFTDAGIDVGVAFSLTDKKQATFGGVDRLVMLANATDKPMAAKLMLFLTSKDVHAEYMTLSGSQTIHKDGPYVGPAVFEDLYTTSDVDIIQALPVVAGSVPVYTTLYKSLQQMMLGQKTPAEALQDAAEAGDKSLADAQK